MRRRTTRRASSPFLLAPCVANPPEFTYFFYTATEGNTRLRKGILERPPRLNRLGSPDDQHAKLTLKPVLAGVESVTRQRQISYRRVE